MRVFLLAFAIVLVACNASGPDVAKLAEDHLRSKMKDPSSFEKIESRVVDTVTQKEHWERELRKDTDALNALLSGDTSSNSTRIQYRRDYIAMDQKELSAISTDAPYCYKVLVKYRAKNGFGAVGLDQKIVEYYPKDTSFVIAKN